jgi:hypothetical protein
MINDHTHTHKLPQKLTINQTINLRSSEIGEYSEGDTLGLSLVDDVITVRPDGFNDGVDE